MRIKKIVGRKYDLTDGSSFTSIIIHASLAELISRFGDPSTVGSTDEKTQVEWIWQIKKNGCVTLYDWKQRKSIFEIKEWHVGSNLENEEVLKVLKSLGFNSTEIWHTR